MLQLQPSEAKRIIQQGGVIAYPTEAVYGLGCDPDNQDAIGKLLTIKQRPWEKGLILVAAELQQLEEYVDFSQLTALQQDYVKSHWPGPFTFIMPTFTHISTLLRGQYDSIAVRVSEHPIVRELCLVTGKPLVSTSANIAGASPALNGDTIMKEFSEQVDALILGELGQQQQPSTIIDAISGKILRQG